MHLYSTGNMETDYYRTNAENENAVRPVTRRVLFEAIICKVSGRRCLGIAVFEMNLVSDGGIPTHPTEYEVLFA